MSLIVDALAAYGALALAAGFLLAGWVAADAAARRRRARSNADVMALVNATREPGEPTEAELQQWAADWKEKHGND